MEFTINVHVTGLEGLAEAIKALAERKIMKDMPVSEEIKGAEQEVSTQRQMQPVQTAEPIQQVTPPAIQTPPVVPTTQAEQNYTMEQLAIAMTGLMDAGKVAEVQEIIQRFGVQTLMQVPEASYGQLAVAIREAGGVI